MQWQRCQIHTPCLFTLWTVPGNLSVPLGYWALQVRGWACLSINQLLCPWINFKYDSIANLEMKSPSLCHECHFWTPVAGNRSEQGSMLPVPLCKRHALPGYFSYMSFMWVHLAGQTASVLSILTLCKFLYHAYPYSIWAPSSRALNNVTNVYHVYLLCMLPCHNCCIFAHGI